MISLLLTPSQYIALYLFSFYAMGVTVVCHQFRNLRGPALDLRPAIAVQLAILCCMGLSSLLWPNYPQEGAGEYARVLCWLPALWVGYRELSLASLKRDATLHHISVGPVFRIGILLLFAWLVYIALQCGDLITSMMVAISMIICLPLYGRIIPSSNSHPSRYAVFANMVFLCVISLCAWFLSPSKREVLPYNAENIQESYLQFVFPPDFSYQLSADLSKEDAQSVAQKLGFDSSKLDGMETQTEGRCEQELRWKPPQLLYTYTCY